MRYTRKSDIDKICNYVELHLLTYYMSRCIEIAKFPNDLPKNQSFFYKHRLHFQTLPFFGSSVYPVTNEKRLINSEVHDY